jgi:homogentisate 1,2-dioxygenase
MEDSIGVDWTDELAVMVDTFKPLKVARPARDVEDENYWKSWQP